MKGGRVVPDLETSRPYSSLYIYILVLVFATRLDFEHRNIIKSKCHSPVLSKAQTLLWIGWQAGRYADLLLPSYSRFWKVWLTCSNNNISIQYSAFNLTLMELGTLLVKPKATFDCCIHQNELELNEHFPVFFSPSFNYRWI